MGLRTISVQMRASSALDALFVLEGAPGVSAALRSALQQELERVREPLSLLAECVWWLAEGKLFRRDRASSKRASSWKPGKPVRSAALFEGELVLDVPRLVAQVETGDEHARVTSVAARSVLEAVRTDLWVSAVEARSGRARVDAGALCKEVRAHLERAERAAQKAAERNARVQREQAREERERQESEERAQRARREARAARRAQREHEERARAEQERLERERAEREARAKSAASAKSGKGKRGKGKPTSFGGLPDDAEPEDRTREPEKLGKRGLPLDAEFFLDEAAIPWPIDGRTLESARKSLLVRFHPDRAGDAGVEKFQRAMRGYQALVKAIEKDSGNARAAERSASVAAAHTTRSDTVDRTARSEPVAPKAAPTTPEPVASKPRKRASKVERTAAPAAAPAAVSTKATRAEPDARGGSGGEWPPRAPRAGAK